MNELPFATFIPVHPAEPSLSVVIPIRNEAENILPLVAEMEAVLAGFCEKWRPCL